MSEVTLFNPGSATNYHAELRGKLLDATGEEHEGNNSSGQPFADRSGAQHIAWTPESLSPFAEM